MRGRIVVAAALVVVVAAAIVIAVVFLRKDGGPADAVCRLATPPSGAPAADPGEVRIAEQGFTRIGSPASSVVTIGAVLENPSDRVAYRTRVSFDVLSPDGQSVVQDIFRTRMVMEVPLLLPGARVPVGNVLGPNRLAEVGRVSIKPVVSQWLPRGDGHEGLAPVTATLVPAKTTRDAEGTGVIYFDAQSANCADLVSRGASYVLRDSTGKLIGGGFSNGPEPDGCTIGDNRSTNAFNTALRGVPESADLAKTEVASLCDLARKPPATGIDAPNN